MRKLTTVAVAATCALAAAAPAAAAPKQERILVDSFTDTYSGSVDCGAYGPYDHDVLYSGTQRFRIVDVVAADGTLLRTILTIRTRETQTNSETGYKLPLRGAVHEVWDYGSNTRTLSGAVWMGNEPGEGTFVHDSGRITMTLDTRIASFVAGPKEVFLGGLDELVCVGLAERQPVPAASAA